MAKNEDDDLKAEVEGLQSPITARHGLPAPAGSLRSGVLNVERVLSTWDSNIKTLRAVVDILRRTGRNLQLTRWVTVLALLIALVAMSVLGWLVGRWAEENRREVEGAKASIEAAALATDRKFLEQDKKMDQLLGAVANLLQAKLADEAARARPKDQELKKEATRVGLQALGSALAAKKRVAPTEAAKVEAVKQLQEVKQLAEEKGLDVQLTP